MAIKDKGDAEVCDGALVRPRRPTIIDVGKIADVSVATVSNVLNDRPYVDAATKARVLKAIKTLGYTPNVRAQRLRTGRADTLGVFISLPFPTGPTRVGYSMEIAAVAAAEAAESGMAVMLVPPLDSWPERLSSFHVDGAIIIEPAGDAKFVPELVERGIPVVSIGAYPGSLKLPFIELHSHAVITMLLAHLFENGAKRIAFVGSAHSHDLQVQSERAYAAFCASKKLSPVSFVLDEAIGADGARVAVRAFLQNHPEIDGICVPYDPFALGAMQAAVDVDRHVPTRLKIATRYNSVRVQEAGITAVDLHLAENAKLAVDILLKQLNSGRLAKSVSGPMPTLIPRNSSRKN